MISHFTGEFRWLSNFYPAAVWFEGMLYPTVEHAYQAAKTLDRVEREMVLACETAGRAKRAGRKLTLRADWEDIKLAVMEALLRQKFAQADLAEWLLATGEEPIEEGNNWGDRFWGVCKGEGQNHLGRILMKIRAELRASAELIR